MKPIEIIANDLFEKVRSRFSNLQMGDENGTVTTNSKDARFFDFDFVVEGNNLGRVSISINDMGNLKIFYGQGITEGTDSIVQGMWYDFLREMRFFAKRRLLRFDTRDIAKGNLDKNDFRFLSQQKSNEVTESSMFGSSKTSYRKLEDTSLIIRHTEAIDPEKTGARSRKIKNLFIQNKDGERFKFPFKYLPGARAMQRHVANGGYPHDDAGKKIIKTCEEILKLSDFGKKVKYSSLNDSAYNIVEKAGQKLGQLRHHMESMSKQKYYESWMESQQNADNSLVELDEVTLETYKNTFTVQKFDETLSDVFPILHAIMQETNEIDLDEYVEETFTRPLRGKYPGWVKYIEEDRNSWSLHVPVSNKFIKSPVPITGITIWVPKPPEEVDSAGDLGVMWDTEGLDRDQLHDMMTNLYSKNIFEEPLHQLLATLGFSSVASSSVQVSEWGMQDEGRASYDAFGVAEEIQNVMTSIEGESTMQEISTFESWADSLVNEMFSDDELENLQDLVTQPLPVGANGEAVQALAGIGITDPSLVNALQAIAKMPNGADADARETIKSYLGAEASKLDWGDLESAPVAPEPAPAPEPSDMAEPVPAGPEEPAPAPTEEDSDEDFVASLRNKMKRHKDDNIDPDSKDRLIEPDSSPKNSKMKEVADIVSGFYNREDGTWTKGEHGVVTHVKRCFSNDSGKGGEKEAALAAKLIQHLNQKNEAQQTFEDIRKLAGLSMSEAKKPSAGLSKKEKSATVKKAKAGSDIGKKGKSFDTVAKAAGGGEKGKRIAAAAMWKNIKR